MLVAGGENSSGDLSSAELFDPASDNFSPTGNTGFGESRPSLSRDAEQLLFGRAGPAGTGEGGTGLSDVYVTARGESSD